MRENYKRLGDYIQPVNIRNKDLEVSLLLGVSVQKIFIPSIANTVGTNFKNYKIVEKEQFVYIADTSRRGDKIGIALLEDYDKALVSQAYTVFKIIDKSKLLPQYLMMWFRRAEFDRYARYKSYGSVREVFDWEEMCEVELPIPSIEKQRAIVTEYQSVENKIKTNEQICEKLEATAQALYKHWFIDFEFPHSPPQEGCQPTADGVVLSTLEKYPQDDTLPRDTKAYMSLPYNAALKDRARALRKAGNLAEVLFWKQVRNKQFLGLDFDRQKIIGNYIVDFYNANNQVVIEIDGSSHDDKQEYDAKRDAYLESLGLTVIHITDKQVKKEIDSVMRYLTDHPTFKIPLHGRGGRRSGWSHTAHTNHKSTSSPQKEAIHKEQASQSKEEETRSVGKEHTDHPAFQAPLQRRGTMGYKSSGGKMVYNEELDKEIPEGWEVNTIDKYVSLSQGLAINKKTRHYIQESGLPLLRITDLINGKSEIYISEDINENLIAKKEDIIVTRTGQVGLVFRNKEGVIYNNCFKVMPLAKLNEEVLYWFLKTKDMHNKMIELASGSSAQLDLTHKQFYTIKFILPNELCQKLFVEKVKYIGQILNSIFNQNQKLSKFQDLFLSRMASEN